MDRVQVKKLYTEGTDLIRVTEGFLTEHGLSGVVAFSGGLNPKDAGSERRAQDMLHEILDGFAPNRFAVQSGGTKWDIPWLAIQAARNQNMKTIGIYPRHGQKHAIPSDLIDLAIEVGPVAVRAGEERPGQWGDESSTFANMADVIVVIGGGPGTMVEVGLAMKRNGEATRKTVIVPMLGFGGIADLLPKISETISHGNGHLIRPIRTAQEAVTIIDDVMPK